jgi:UDP-2-acetamido-2,6-beta-L-arabino-hexul-4-ose reductase
MIKIGITGQPGFVGTHLFNTLGLNPAKYDRIPFEDSFFSDKNKLFAFVENCDAIVHLAAMNRHNDPDILYQTNIRLVKQIIEACEATNSTPHILFSSSTQEDRENLYGKSKKEGRQLFEIWASKNSANFTGFIIPNVYGPFGNPYFNSVVATFCHQLTHDEKPQIEIDGTLKLIPVANLVQQIIERIELVQTDHQNDCVIEEVRIQHRIEMTVSHLLELLDSFKTRYYDLGEIPSLDTEFKTDLFTTFLTYIDHQSFFPFKLKMNNDERGSFVETIKLNSGGQISFSTTVPGITRGNHYHTRKAERFAVIKGKAKIELRRIGTDKILSFELDGRVPSFVDMPIWFTHKITNIGDGELYTIFWINEHFDVSNPDTYFEKV